jgi:adenylate cyclase
LPDLSHYKRSRIKQGYIVVGDQIEVRVRKKGSKHTIGIKQGSGEVRKEVEISISKSKFESLWPFTQKKRVFKTRYEIPFHGLKIELDVYSGKLKGLKTAEIEFKSSRRNRRLKLPEWIGKEVTEQRRYSNAHLAEFGVPGKR